MGYSTEENMVRVDFFKESGKWYATEAIDFLGGSEDPDKAYNEEHPMNVFQRALVHHLKYDDGTLRYAGMRAVCLEPYHDMALPLMTTIPDTVWSTP